MTTSLKRRTLTGLAFLATSAAAFALPQGQVDVADVAINVIDGDCGCSTVTEQFITVGLPDGSMRESEPITNGTFEFTDVGNKFTLFFNNRGADIDPMEFSFDGRNERIALQVLMTGDGIIKEVSSKIVPVSRRGKNTKVRQLGGPPKPVQGAPANDSCAGATEIACGSTATTDNTAATTDVGDPPFTCHFSGPTNQGVGTIWHTFVATGTQADIDTNLSAVSDTLLAVYDGSCGSLVELECSEDEGDGFLSELTVTGLTVGNTYYIQAASWSDSSRGLLTVRVECSDAPVGDAGDDCADANAVDCNSLVTVDNTSATDDASDPIFSCRAGGPGAGSGSLWFTFVATDTSARIDTELSTGATDTLLAVYDGTCGAFTELACSEDEGVGLLSLLDVFGLTVGNTYYVQVANFSSFSTRGDMTLQIACPAPAPPEGRCCFSDGSCMDLSEDDCLNVMGGNSWDEGLTCASDPCPIPPANDNCDGAEDLGPLPASISFDNTEATSDIAVPCGVFSGPWNNVWYKVTGTGNTITASTCNLGSEVSDTKISVFCADCLTLPCVAGNDDDCPAGGQSFQSTVSWCSQPGVDYFITVGNFGEFDAGGVIQLDVTDDGVPCVADVSCVATGACCLEDGSCVIASEDDCTGSGGTYLGDNTICSSNNVADPSFEGGAFGGTWTEFSLNFGTPLCDGGSCGFGGGTGPNTGDWWCWFGGIAAFEQGLVEQSVVIPAGSNTLSFALEIPTASGNGVDYMDVLVDGNLVYSASEADGPYLGYLPVSVDISAYADGGVHLVTFFSEIVGDAVTNFFVDDIEIGADLAGCRECVTLDFETEDDFLTPLVDGQDIDTEFGELVVITGTGPNLGPAIFDTSEFGPNFGGDDEDLLVRTGNALILQDLPTQTVPGIYDTASDDSDGGTLSFDFVSPSELLSVDLIDVDLGPGVQDVTVVLTDAAGATRTYSVPGGWTKDIAIEGAPGFGTLDLTTLADQPGAHATATAVEDAEFDAAVVVRMDVVFSSSSALDNLSFCQ